MEEYCKVLIVDDEYIMRRGIRYMLDWESLGFQVVGEASNGKEALDQMEEQMPHIVLCDIAMPVMDGIDFIQIVHRKYPGVQVVILSGHDKFEYVRQALRNGAVDYVLKPTLNPEELSRILIEAVSRIPGIQLKKKKSYSLENQMENFLRNTEEEIANPELFSYFPDSCYRIVGVPMHFYDLNGKKLCQMICEKAEYYLKENAPGKYLAFMANSEFLCVVFNYSMKDENKWNAVIQEMGNQLRFIHNQIFVVMGTSHQKMSDLKKDFANPEFQEAEIFYHKGSYVYEIKEWKKSKPIVHKFDFRYFSTIVSEGRYSEAIGLFGEYIENSLEARIPEFKLKNQTKNLLYNFIGSVNVNADRLEQIRQEYFMKIDEAMYMEEFHDILQKLKQELTECFSGSQDKKLQKMQEYISEHYQDDLELMMLAEKFNFNYSYLSSYFNSNMGEGFSEYLNRIRINHACRYLEKDEYSIAVVSGLVGYSDQSYFCRVFKKITGETPSTYRRRHKSGKI